MAVWTRDRDLVRAALPAPNRRMSAFDPKRTCAHRLLM